MTFHNLSSGNFTSCNWDYGDGNFGTFCAESHDHVYLNPGTYTVQLTVTGPDGSDSLTRSDYITVSGSPCPTISNWKGEYWNNPDLSGEPTLCRNDEAIDFEWYDGSPDPAIVDEGFSARWTKDMTFDAGEYHFDIFHDDGARFYIDGEPILDNWCDDCRLWERVTKTLSAGSHPLKLEMFENSGWAAAKLVITPADPSLHAHEIQLQSGWNMISSYIEPQNPNMPDVFAACDVVLVKNGDGEVYWPEFGINQIGNWNVVEGYQVYMNVPCTLTLSGTQVAPEATPISLNAGWSLIGYLRDTPIPIDQALASISDVLVIVKNNAGEVYWPEFGVNQIGDMQPGEGYQIYVSAPATLIYPANE